MAVGRKQVAPRQTIASQWGNQVWDQSVNSFATAADRTSQWPSPQLGALSYLESAPRVLWQWQGTAWNPIVQSGQHVVTTTAAGGWTITFNVPFSSVPVLVAMDADSSSTSLVIVGVSAALVSTTQANGAARQAGTAGVPPHANSAVRINYLATTSFT